MADNFEQAIISREKDKIKSDFTFIGIKESNLEKYEKIKNELLLCEICFRIIPI